MYIKNREKFVSVAFFFFQILLMAFSIARHLRPGGPSLTFWAINNKIASLTKQRAHQLSHKSNQLIQLKVLLAFF